MVLETQDQMPVMVPVTQVQMSVMVPATKARMPVMVPETQDQMPVMVPVTQTWMPVMVLETQDQMPVMVPVRLRSYQHGRTEMHVFPSVRGRGCVHTNTDGPDGRKKMARTKKQKLMLWWWWRRRVNKVHSIRRFSVHPVNRSRHVHGEYHHLIPVLLDDPFKLPSTWGWTLTHFTIYWMSALQSCGKNIPTTASLVKDTRPYLNCGDQFLVVHAALLCLSRKSNALSKYQNAWKVQSLERTDGKDRACTFLKKSSVSVRVSMNAFHVTSGNKERFPVHVFHLRQSSVSVRVGMNVP